ncbi:hypothetical protein THAOC_36591 [Thalassiosira oceanica]|uniref:Uncharacterized protein n=1 Tax=Thalassiosira oceanica TaxID=159749 RepID=K0QZY3_THAOC|nr:hypothetical protein THAOC_36591 [Thalassiosira oceanica]|eukprot:EJK44840.1 hypothetical protein THAOC_36591 [Thalassiosira oceanica]
MSVPSRAATVNSVLVPCSGGLESASHEIQGRWERDAGPPPRHRGGMRSSARMCSDCPRRGGLGPAGSTVAVEASAGRDWDQRMGDLDACDRGVEWETYAMTKWPD